MERKKNLKNFIKVLIIKKRILEGRDFFKYYIDGVLFGYDFTSKKQHNFIKGLFDSDLILKCLEV